MRWRSRAGLVIEITSDDQAVLVWLRELFAPALDEDLATPPAWQLELRASPADLDAIVRQPDRVLADIRATRRIERVVSFAG